MLGDARAYRLHPVAAKSTPDAWLQLIETIKRMGVKLVPYSLFLIRKEIRNEKYVSFLIPYLIRNKE